MNAAAIVRALLDLLRAKPATWPAVEAFWGALRGNANTAADTERFDEQMAKAIEEAKITAASR